MNTNLSSYWCIDGEPHRFASLSAAKFHIWLAYTDRERVKCLHDSYIYHVIDEEIISVVSIRVGDTGKAHFSRPVKI